MRYVIYWLVSENKKKTYIGFTDDIKRRIKEHRNKKVKTTRDFGNFKVFILENIQNENEIEIREKYWKSCAGRKKLKKLFEKYIDNAAIV
ncbi:MAG: GIY-YIG nuclease family protein [Candidatus Moranbacteria bacterium]|nr:GIY-YIG nuclease family protein [Candidatus Moranbacteria bacterium]